MEMWITTAALGPATSRAFAAGSKRTGALHWLLSAGGLIDSYSWQVALDEADRLLSDSSD